MDRDVERRLFEVESGMKQIAEHIGKEAERRTLHEANAQRQMQVEDRIKVISAAFDKSQAYMNIVILAGYAGLFAVWGFTAQAMSSWVVVAVGLSLLISIVTYVLFEVWKMATEARFVIRRGRLHELLPDSEKYLAELDELEADRISSIKWFDYYVWPAALFITAISGIVGAVLMALTFVMILL